MKDAESIAVEGHRLSVALEIPPGGAEVVERGLDLGEGEFHEPARGVVDVHEQRAHGTAVLEPRVLRAVDLDELAETGPPGPRRLAAPQALPPGHGKGEAVLLGELLMREGRTEVGVETLRGWMTAVGLWVYRSRTRVSACSRVAVANWRLLGRPRWRDARALAPSRRNARYRRRTWRSLSPSSAAARRRVSRRSASWDITCSRSSSPIVNATVSAMAPLWPRGGHFYFGETGHLHFGPTVGGLIGRVT